MADPRTETQSIELSAPPAAVVEVLRDASRLPAWAPAFADAVDGDAGSGWVVTKGPKQFPLRVPIDEGAATVDYLRTSSSGEEGGAYLRVVPRPGGGSVVVMTIPVAPGVPLAHIASTLREELTALAALVDEAR
jgi:hypothetical protein